MAKRHSFQRDPVRLETVIKLLRNVSRWSSAGADSEQKDWQAILLADNFRVLRMHGIAISLAKRISQKTLSSKHRFWSLHVLATALHYSGQVTAAEESFMASRQWANRLELSFSHQHLGKLRAEQGDFVAADIELRSALHIRKALDRPSLVDSTLSAVKELQQLKSKAEGGFN